MRRRQMKQPCALPKQFRRGPLVTMRWRGKEDAWTPRFPVIPPDQTRPVSSPSEAMLQQN